LRLTRRARLLIITLLNLKWNAYDEQLASNIRTFNTMFNNLRRDPAKNLDASLLKEITFRERKYLQLRFEAYNITNRVTFNAPDVRPNVATFGLITGQANTERRVQIAARIVW